MDIIKWLQSKLQSVGKNNPQATSGILPMEGQIKSVQQHAAKTPYVPGLPVTPQTLMDTKVPGANIPSWLSTGVPALGVPAALQNAANTTGRVTSLQGTPTDYLSAAAVLAGANSPKSLMPESQPTSSTPNTIDTSTITNSSSKGPWGKGWKNIPETEVAGQAAKAGGPSLLKKAALTTAGLLGIPTLVAGGVALAEKASPSSMTTPEQKKVLNSTLETTAPGGVNLETDMKKIDPTKEGFHLIDPSKVVDAQGQPISISDSAYRQGQQAIASYLAKHPNDPVAAAEAAKRNTYLDTQYNSDIRTQYNTGEQAMQNVRDVIGLLNDKTGLLGKPQAWDMIRVGGVGIPSLQAAADPHYNAIVTKLSQIEQAYPDLNLNLIGATSSDNAKQKILEAAKSIMQQQRQKIKTFTGGTAQPVPTSLTPAASVPSTVSTSGYETGSSTPSSTGTYQFTPPNPAMQLGTPAGGGGGGLPKRGSHGLPPLQPNGLPMKHKIQIPQRYMYR